MALAISRSGRLGGSLTALKRAVRNSILCPPSSAWGWIGIAVSGLWLYQKRRFGMPEVKRRYEPTPQDQQKQERLDPSLLDAFPSHICILDENGTIIAVNRAWREFAEANPPLRSNVCEGANYLAVCDAAEDDPTASIFALRLRAVLSGRLSQFSVEYPCHSPWEERWFTARVFRYRDESPVRVAVKHEAITARKLAERAARESEDRYSVMIEQALDGLYVLNRNGCFSLVNNATCLMTGYPQEELIGMHATQVLSPEEHSHFAVIWEKLMAGGIDQSEWCLRRKDGSRLNIEVRARMQADGQVVGFARDVTARKEAEALRQARDAAEAANRAKDQFLAMLSHELRTPLAPVLMATRMIEQDETLPAHVRDLAATIHRNIEVQAHLIDDLLDQTRIARGKLELHHKVVSVNEAIDHVLHTLQSEIDSKQLQVRVDLCAKNTHVQADVARLQQILWNLLKNAVKFTSSAGIITIRTANPEQNRIRIEVTDTGIGIDPELLPRIFHPFEQGGTATTRRFGGLGLGLAISQKLAELHGGTLTAYSAGKNCGSTFIFELPTADTNRDNAPAQAHPPRRQAAPQGLRILLVEDHADTARILARLLARHGHYVHVSSTLHDAESAAESEPFDLVLSDLDLPDGTGYELMEFLQKTHPLPGIAMSGFGMEQDISKSREAGFAEHLVKPVDPSRLEEAIEHVAVGAT